MGAQLAHMLNTVLTNGVSNQRKQVLRGRQLLALSFLLLRLNAVRTEPAALLVLVVGPSAGVNEWPDENEDQESERTTDRDTHGCLLDDAGAMQTKKRFLETYCTLSREVQKM